MVHRYNGVVFCLLNVYGVYVNHRRIPHNNSLVITIEHNQGSQQQYNFFNGPKLTEVEPEQHKFTHVALDLGLGLALWPLRALKTF
jgi:hypothetical protein